MSSSPGTESSSNPGLAQSLKALLDLNERINTEFQEMELLSITGAAAGERYPVLLEAHERLAVIVPKVQKLAEDAGIPVSTASRAAASSQGRGSEDQGDGIPVDRAALAVKLQQEIESALEYFKSIPNLQPAEGESTETPLQGEMSEDAKAIARGFERMLGEKNPHPSKLAFGMIPNKQQREAWAKISMGEGL